MTGSQSILELPSYSLILDGDNGLFNQVYKSKNPLIQPWNIISSSLQTEFMS